MWTRSCAHLAWLLDHDLSLHHDSIPWLIPFVSGRIVQAPINHKPAISFPNPLNNEAVPQCVRGSAAASDWNVECGNLGIDTLYTIQKACLVATSQSKRLFLDSVNWPPPLRGLSWKGEIHIKAISRGVHQIHSHLYHLHQDFNLTLFIPQDTHSSLATSDSPTKCNSPMFWASAFWLWPPMRLFSPDLLGLTTAAKFQCKFPATARLPTMPLLQGQRARYLLLQALPSLERVAIAREIARSRKPRMVYKTLISRWTRTSRTTLSISTTVTSCAHWRHRHAILRCRMKIRLGKLSHGSRKGFCLGQG